MDGQTIESTNRILYCWIRLPRDNTVRWDGDPRPWNPENSVRSLVPWKLTSSLYERLDQRDVISDVGLYASFISSFLLY